MQDFHVRRIAGTGHARAAFPSLGLPGGHEFDRHAFVRRVASCSHQQLWWCLGLSWVLITVLIVSTPERCRLPERRSLYSVRGSALVTLDAAIALKETHDIKALHPLCSGSNVTGRVLVTGAAGFVGYHASKRLHGLGYVVIGLDNFNTYYPVSLKRSRQDSLHGLNIPVIEGDISDGTLLGELFKTCNFSYVVHMAAQAGVRYGKKNPQAYISNNIQGTVTLLEAIKEQQPMPKLLFASSSSVYGLTKHTPFTEEDKIDEPASLYAATKHSVELIVHVYHHLYGVSATGLRFFTVYGPWGRPDMSYMMFARSILDGKPIKIFQGPNHTELARDFTYVEDITIGVANALSKIPPSTKRTAAFRVYNLGNTHPMTITDMVSMLSKHLNKTAIITYVPVPAAGDVLFTHANISAAAAAFDYAPKTNLDEGLLSFAQWFFMYYGADGKKRAIDDEKYVPY